MEKVIIEVAIPKKLYEKLKALVESGEYSTLSEAVRAAIRSQIA
ncbi:MAG: ribbon-helix-helix domain-containing protein [Candidatus Bathyarchaeota archaeon]|nr:ribbon-helix-helix domain-containing protein [Candidatus Bathyarchaeota archaeon]